MNKKVFAGIKFLVDRIGAILLILATSPIMIFVAIGIKLDDSGSVVFRQIRTGKGGQTFYLYKFRTMHMSNDVLDSSKSDEYTVIGRFLRRFSLDELPQLFNIAKGDMSFIGPRPWIHNYYENMTDEQRHRNDVRPGLTGLAQVMGRNHLSIFEKINYDLIYVRQYSLLQEVRIILLTIKTVLSGSGVDSGKETIHEELEALRQYKKENS